MTRILGIVNVTDNSFSDGGKFLDPAAARIQARKLMQEGADIVDVGAASSHPDSSPVTAEVEIKRLSRILPLLREEGIPFSVDSFQAEVQRYALTSGAAYLNDIHGFPDSSFYAELAASSAKLIVMHAVQSQGNATRENVPPEEIVGRIESFFDERVAALVAAGIAKERLILDPGLGFFLGTDPLCSVRALQAIKKLTARYGVPILVGVSRKSFVRNLAGVSMEESLPATLAGELYAVRQGAAYIRTHEVAPLIAALRVQEALEKSR